MILIEKYKAIEKTWEEPSYSDPLNVLTEIRDRLNALPTIEIVRCKDCKHGRLFDTNCVDCEYRELATDADWFCADGKRRDEDAQT